MVNYHGGSSPPSRTILFYCNTLILFNIIGLYPTPGRCCFVEVSLSRFLCQMSPITSASHTRPWGSTSISKHTLIPVCPEQLGGLPTPRQPAEIIHDAVVIKNGTNLTEAFLKGAEQTLSIAKQLGCTHAILKQNSPSCGCGKIYDGTFTGNKIIGNGLTAKMLMDNGIIVIAGKSLDSL